jgi:hypothetical protein
LVATNNKIDVIPMHRSESVPSPGKVSRPLDFIDSKDETHMACQVLCYQGRNPLLL